LPSGYYQVEDSKEERKTLMLRLYKTDDEGFFYAECWVDDNIATIHTGAVGDMGESKEISCNNESLFLDEFCQEYQAQGYDRWPDQERYWVVLQWPMKTLHSNAHWCSMRDRASRILDDWLGWTGLGHVDGFDMGRTSNPKEEFVLNIFCLVVNSDLAIKYIVDTLPTQLDCSRLKVASKKYDEDTYTLNYCARPKECWFYV
jgi:hypothetical protein